MTNQSEQAKEKSLHEAVEKRTQGERNCYLGGAIFGAQWNQSQPGIKQWVSVVDDLPKDAQWYRVLREGKIFIFPCRFEDGKWFEYGEPFATEWNITHWQPFDDLENSTTTPKSDIEQDFRDFIRTHHLSAEWDKFRTASLK